MTGSYGGDPDAAANANTTTSNLGTPDRPFSEQDAKQTTELAAFQIFMVPATTSTGADAPVLTLG